VSKYHWSRLYALLLMIVLFALSILLVSGKVMVFYRQYITQTSIIHGTEAITSASNSIIDQLSICADSCANDQYESLLRVSQNPKAASLDETELNDYFRIGYYNKLKSYLGDNPQDITSTLNAIIEKSGNTRVSVITDDSMMLTKETDNSGRIVKISLADVTLKYSDPIIGERTDTLSYVINIPDAIFYTGNDELFDYCMIAGKGIYMTGATSSVIGNIYAGRHSSSEVRDSDKIYGESSVYGGLNILSTQIGFNSDRIICDGDININGSFVIFSGENHELICYGNRLNNLDSFAKESMYSLNGIFYSVAKNDESVLQDFYNYQNNVEVDMSKLGEIEIYYDTANIENFEGPYRVLMSTSDIEIKNDFTGIIMTPCNVIVGNDVNIEGLIICGDRIYTRGNNNIVANKEVLRKIIQYETTHDFGMKAYNYLGGILPSGLSKPGYYVIPYR